MARDYDDLFAKTAIQLRRLAPAQIMACREVLAELESAGVTKPLARVAVDQGLLSQVEAAKLIAEINQKHPGKHPPLAPSAALAAPRTAPGPASPAPPRESRRPAAPPAPRGRAAPEAAPPAPAPAAPSRSVAPAGPALRKVKSPGPVSRATPGAAPPRGPRPIALWGGAAALLVGVAAAGLFLARGSSPAPAPAPLAAGGAAGPEPARAPAPPPAPPAPAPQPAAAAAPAPRVEPRAVPAPPPPPPPAPAAAADDGFRAQFEEAVATRKKEGAERLNDAKRELAQEQKEADEVSERTRRRLAERKVTFALASGETIKDAIVRSFTFYGATLDAAGKEVRITWDAVQPASWSRLADILFDPARAADQFDRGRFFVARRRWKEAQAAFSAAAKLGQGYESRVLEFSEVLDRLASGQGGFRGSARRTGQDGVHLTWDFHDAKQLEDFTSGLTLGPDGVLLEAPSKFVVYLFGGTSSGSDESPLAFVGSLDVRVKLRSAGPVLFHLFAGPGGAYEIELGSAGVTLHKIGPAGDKEVRRLIAKSDAHKLAPSKASEVRLSVTFPKFKVMLDGAEALSGEDGPVAVTAEPPKGAFGFGLPKGKLTLEAPLEIGGRAETAELERRIGDTEVMVRRALDPDLEQIERFRARRKAMSLLNESPDQALSSDHIYFLNRLQPDYNRYEELRKKIGGDSDKQTAEQWKAEMEALVAKHPKVPSLYYVLAAFKHDHQDLDGGLAELRKAIEIYPDFYEALTLESQILLERQDARAALEAVRRALAARPDYVPAYVILARCVYATSGSLKEFMEDLDLARKLDPQDSSALTVQRRLKYQRLGPKELGCRFDCETDHYRVTSDISLEASRRYGENLEAAFRHYSGAFSGASPVLGEKPRVSIFMTAENYYTYFELLSDDRGENTLGVFFPDLNELVLFEKSGDLADTNHTLYHEAFHHFMSLLTVRTPPFWYNEGIAEYMGSIKIRDGKIQDKALVLEGRLPYILLAIEVKADMPFDKIMNETPREFYSGNVGLKYAQAWSMIHFFYEYNKGKYRPLIEEYFALLRSGRTARESFDAVFKAKQEALQEEWRTFTRSLKP